jgi:hypothetical protein
MISPGEQLHIKSNLTLIGNSYINLTSASQRLILWEDPYKNKGSFAGALEGTTQVKYVTTTTDIETPGDWKMQIKATIATNVFYGAVAILHFEDILE